MPEILFDYQTPGIWGQNTMATIYDINPSELIEKASKELKKTKTVQMPEWAMVVKTGPAQERQPSDLDWWYLRSASILRKVYTKGPIGVSKLRTFYGKKKNRGVKPERFYKASGKIIRTILQQLEAEGLIRATEKGVHKGRIVTGKGQALLDQLSCKNGSGKIKKAEVAGVAESASGTATESTEASAGTA
jgi:small subunit ribosomal protein S19e